MSGLPVRKAVERVLRSVSVLAVEEVALSKTCGRVLAEPVRAAEPLPPFTRAAVDGYAVRSSDLRSATSAHPVFLRIAGTTLAGECRVARLSTGDAIGITTGAPLPPPADAVLKEEDVRVCGERVLVCHAVAKGENVFRRGAELRQGELVVQEGYVLEPVSIGVFASMGVRRLLVRRRPRVAVVSTGDELVGLGTAPRTARIRDSNRLLLSCVLSRNGAAAARSRRARDTARDVVQEVKGCVGMDLVVVTGGSGRGRADVVKAALAREGMKMEFDGVAMRPGRTTAFGILQGVPILMLPGTPHAVFVCGEVFLGPALRKMSGRRDVGRPVVPARLAASVRRDPVETRCRTACVVRSGGGYRVTPVAALRTLRRVHTINGILVVAPGDGPIPEGSVVDVELLT